MFQRVRGLISIPVLAAVLASCGDLGGPAFFLDVSFTVHPEAVRPGDSLTVTFKAVNPTDRRITLVSSQTCLFNLAVYRGEEEVTLQGTNYGCGAAFSDFPILAGDSLIHQVEFQAIMQDGTNPRPGHYTVRTLMSTNLRDREASFYISDQSGSPSR